MNARARRPQRGRIGLGAGMVVMVMASALAIGGSVLAQSLAAANPPPARVLGDVRRFVARSRAVSFTARMTVSTPVAGANGSALVTTSDITGVSVARRGWDTQVTEGERVTEYRSTRESPGVLVRTARSGSLSDGQPWFRFPAVEAVDRTMLGPTADPAALEAAIVRDDLALPPTVLLLLGSVRSPRRAPGGDPRLLAVDAPGAVGGRASVRAELAAGVDGRPRSLMVSVRDGALVATANYHFTEWDRADTARAAILTGPPAAPVTAAG